MKFLTPSRLGTNLVSRVNRHRIVVLNLVCVSFFFSGCSILIGNVRPVSEHSSGYSARNLAELSPNWTVLDRGDELSGADIAYQYKPNGSIISLNSTCRERNAREDLSLDAISRSLLLGITAPDQQAARDLQVSRLPARETTVSGMMNGESMKLRVVVLRKEECLYDLMYVAKAARFDEQEATFSDFVTNFQVN